MAQSYFKAFFTVVLLLLKESRQVQHGLIYSDTIYNPDEGLVVEIRRIEGEDEKIERIEAWSSGCDAIQTSLHLCQFVQEIDECAIRVWQQMAEKEMLMAISEKEKHSEWLKMGKITRSNVWWETTASWFPSFMAGHRKSLYTPLTILEIGSYEGGSTLWFLRYLLSHPKSRLVAIDTWSDARDPHSYSPTGDLDRVPNETTKQRFVSNVHSVANAAKLTAIAIDSATGLALLLALRHTFDFIYVDGSHRASEIISDISLSWRLLKPGGLMLLDDYRFPASFQHDFPPETDLHLNSSSDCALPIINRLEANSTLAIDTVLAAVPHGAKVLHCGYQLLVQKRIQSSSTPRQHDEPDLPPSLLIDHDSRLASLLSHLHHGRPPPAEADDDTCSSSSSSSSSS